MLYWDLPTFWELGLSTNKDTDETIRKERVNRGSQTKKIRQEHKMQNRIPKVHKKANITSEQTEEHWKNQIIQMIWYDRDIYVDEEWSLINVKQKYSAWVERRVKEVSLWQRCKHVCSLSGANIWSAQRSEKYDATQPFKALKVTRNILKLVCRKPRSKLCDQASSCQLKDEFGSICKQRTLI